MNMKKNNFFIACIVMSLLGMQSCMDFDVPGDELTGNTEEGSDEVYHGAADILDYHKEISQEGLDLALTNLAKEAPLGYILSATYSMRAVRKRRVLEHMPINTNLICQLIIMPDTWWFLIQTFHLL